MNIIKIRDSPFSLFTWYQSQRGKPIFFFFRWPCFLPIILFSFRNPLPLPPPSDLLAFDDFFRKLFSGRKPHILRSTRLIYTSEETPSKNSHPCAAKRHSSPVACVPRVGACGCVAHFPVLRFHLQARLAPSC